MVHLADGIKRDSEVGVNKTIDINCKRDMVSTLSPQLSSMIQFCEGTVVKSKTRGRRNAGKREGSGPFTVYVGNEFMTVVLRPNSVLGPLR